MLHQNTNDDFWVDLPPEKPHPSQSRNDRLPRTDPTPLHGIAGPILDPGDVLRRVPREAEKKLP